ELEDRAEILDERDRRTRGPQRGCGADRRRDQPGALVAPHARTSPAQAAVDDDEVAAVAGELHRGELHRPAAGHVLLTSRRLVTHRKTPPSTRRKSAP